MIPYSSPPSGKDAASPRYIFTRLHAVTRRLFRPEDDFVLRYRDDDGLPVEPFHYAPVLPMVLINGAEGIGTGFSTSLPTYHPLDVISNVRKRLASTSVRYRHGVSVEPCLATIFDAFCSSSYCHTHRRAPRVDAALDVGLQWARLQR